MALLVIFAFASGLVTALTPCVLPILPIVLSSTATGGKRRPLGIIIGLIASFTIFTLFLTAIVKAFNFSPDILRTAAITVLFLFGLTMIIPKLTQLFEQFTSKLTGRVGGRLSDQGGLLSGLTLGVILGLLWTPCAGPILASVITLAATTTVTTETFLITFAYACGSATMLLLIAYGGKSITNKIKGLGVHTHQIQATFGFIMVAMSIILFFNLDRRFQSYIIQNLPSWALTPLAALESSEQVSTLLDRLDPESNPDQAASLDASRLLTNLGNAPEIVGIEQWFNTDQTPYSIKGLKGKVVLVDFWTYSCINCIRTLPYLRTWHQKYNDKGLVILGIHSPEFAFERVPANVQKAIQDFELQYPVALDNDFQTWRAYSNRYWPAKYLIDANGVIRYRHFGEGRYEDTERAIQLLLAEAGEQAELEITKSLTAQESYSRTPETYMGHARLDTSRLIPSSAIQPDQFALFKMSEKLTRNQFSLGGEWKISEEYAESKPGSKLRLNFYSKEANLVMSSIFNTAPTPSAINATAPAAIQDQNLPTGTNYCTNELCIGSPATDTSGIPVRVRILNPQLINTNRDLREGTVYVNQSKLYQLVELSKPSENIIELEFPEGGVRVFAWTF